MLACLIIVRCKSPIVRARTYVFSYSFMLTYCSQAGLGPMFGYPVVSADTEGNNVLNKGSSAGGATAAVASHLESVGASTSPNTDSVNVAAAQVQYLQAIIQQAGFPFSFSPGHLMPPTMPPTTGHMAQQQVCIFINFCC